MENLHVSTPTLMKEGEVLFDDRKQGDDWRLEVLIVEDIPVLGHVPGRVEKVLQIPEQLLVLAWQLLPGSPQPGDWSQVQAAADETLN